MFRETKKWASRGRRRKGDLFVQLEMSFMFNFGYFHFFRFFVDFHWICNFTGMVRNGVFSVESWKILKFEIW